MNKRPDPYALALSRADVVAAYIKALDADDAQTLAKVQHCTAHDPVLAKQIKTAGQQYNDALDVIGKIQDPRIRCH